MENGINVPLPMDENSASESLGKFCNLLPILSKFLSEDVISNTLHVVWRVGKGIEMVRRFWTSHYNPFAFQERSLDLGLLGMVIFFQLVII